jgi:hypothetical protein
MLLDKILGHTYTLRSLKEHKVGVPVVALQPKRDPDIPVIKPSGPRTLNLAGWHLGRHERNPRKSRLFKILTVIGVISATTVVAQHGINLLRDDPKGTEPKSQKASPPAASKELGQGLSVYTMTPDPKTGEFVSTTTAPKVDSPSQ